MILFHEETLRDDAMHIRRIIEDALEIPVDPQTYGNVALFVPLPQFDGFRDEPARSVLAERFPGSVVLVLTSKDLYGNDKSREDDWVFGAQYRPFGVVATARLMGPDSTPRRSLAVNRELYLRRLALMAIHELGHEFIQAPHHQEAMWVNVRSGTSMALGCHCDDNSCAMYESVDIRTPAQSEGYLMLGTARLYDAGLDAHLNRLRPNWFCQRCEDHLITRISMSSDAR